MISKQIKIGITLGDPSGIGPEICAKAVSALRGKFKLVIIGDSGVWKRGCRLPVPSFQSPVASLQLPVASPQSPVVSRRLKNVGFVDLKNVDLVKFRFGQVRSEYGRASIEYLNKALMLLKSGEIDCLVTCPISKEAINLAGFHYSGHTEYFAKKTRSINVVMMLINKDLKFSLVTRHIPLKDAVLQLNKEEIIKTVTVTENSLKELFGIKYPRLIICGINPHGSDNGLIGDEENRVIRPALDALRRKYKYIDGPLGADAAIRKAKDKKYDCVIAMYHDQALIPLKLLGDETGVNISLGLGFIRTSPLHGTAFDIAGKNLAASSSLITAIKLAAKCVLNQKKT